MNTIHNRVGSEAQYDPRTAGEILRDNLENGNEPLAIAYRKRRSKIEEQGWHANTELGCNLKTLLHSNKRMQKNKNYLGVLRRDSEAIVDEFLSRDEHFTFTEVAPRPYACRRNVRLFEGEQITCTKSLTDGMVRLNFKNLKEDAVFNVDSYALEVANEIRKALNGFVEEKLPRE